MKVIKYVLVFLMVIILNALTLTSGATFESPAVVSAIAPVYPAIAQTAKASGDVLVEVEIDKAGKVSSSRAVSGHNLLRKVSVEAARRWEFMPSTTEEKRTAQLTFSFQIVAEKASGLDRSTVFYPPYHVAVKSEHLVTTTNY